VLHLTKPSRLSLIVAVVLVLGGCYGSSPQELESPPRRFLHAKSSAIPHDPRATPSAEKRALAELSDGTGSKPAVPGIDPVTAWLLRAQEFKPVGDEFPQLVQASDYETALAIEFLYSALRALSRDPKNWSLEPLEPFRFGFEGERLVIFGTTGAVTLAVGDAHVAIAGRIFRASATVTLFRTLHAVLRELSSDFAPVGVLGTQYATRAYGVMTRLGFSCGPLVLELDGAHNGRDDPERLYGLDLVRASDSFLWQPERKD
jgi:hypothetical protein